jgi:hypothetical protein
VSKRFGRVNPGSRLLTLVVPNAVRRGQATLRFELTDSSGNVIKRTRKVTIPRPAASARSPSGNSAGPRTISVTLGVLAEEAEPRAVAEGGKSP